LNGRKAKNKMQTYYIFKDLSFSIMTVENDDGTAKVIHKKYNNPYIGNVIESVCKNIETRPEYWSTLKNASDSFEANSDEEAIKSFGKL
jgi:hypothetical protein